MSAEAIARVPLTDWLMALAVLACGAVAIAAAWRCVGEMNTASSSEDGGDWGQWETPLALPPGPAHRLTVPDEIDRELWALIEAEYERGARRAELQAA
jgi:hypothetical protein